MKVHDATGQVRERRARLLDGLAELVPSMRLRALDLDRTGGFVAEDVALIAGLGALAAPLPVALGGLGMGSEPEGAADLLMALRLVGRGSLSVGRVYEAHVNALRLIVRCGSAAQARVAAEAALAGNLFGLWVTDPPDAPLRVMPDGRLAGGKQPCSGAGSVTRALVTAQTPAGETVMLMVAMDGRDRADLSGWHPHGMRASESGGMALDGLRVDDSGPIGRPGDYLRQPDFSAGAWRTSAVTLGGLEALTAEMRRLIVLRGHQDDPHQLARIGQALIAAETAALWMARAAELAEANKGDAGMIANYVNLARLAVERACLEGIQIAQRALGMAAFRRGGLAELLFRDLAMYLRQPVPDLALTDAARYFTGHALPPCR